MNKSQSRLVRIGMLAFAGAVSAIIASAAMAIGPFDGCGPRYCPQNYRPVLCPDGNTYPNSCYAAQACQTNCVPTSPF